MVKLYPTSRSLKVDTGLKLISLKVDYDFGLASLRNTPFFSKNLREGLTFLHEILARSIFARKTLSETPFDEVDTLEVDWVWGSLKGTFAGVRGKGSEISEASHSTIQPCTTCSTFPFLSFPFLSAVLLSDFLFAALGAYTLLSTVFLFWAQGSWTLACLEHSTGRNDPVTGGSTRRFYVADLGRHG